MGKYLLLRLFYLKYAPFCHDFRKICLKIDFFCSKVCTVLEFGVPLQTQSRIKQYFLKFYFLHESHREKWC